MSGCRAANDSRSARPVLRWLSGAVGSRGCALVAGLVALQVVSALLAVCLAPVMQRAVDAAVGGQAAAFKGLAALFCGLIFAQIALRAGFRYLNELTSATVENRLRGRVFASVLSMPAREAEGEHSAALMSRMTSDVQVVTNGVVSLIPTLASIAIRLVGVLAVMYVLASPLAIAFTVVGVAMVVLSAGLRRTLKQRHRDVQDAESAVRCFIQDCLESLLVVRAFGVEGKMRERNAGNMDAHLRRRMRKNTVSNIANTGFSLVIQGGYMFGFVWCGLGILSGALSYGTLVAVIQLVGQIQAPIANLGGMFSAWASTAASAERLMEVLDRAEGAVGVAGAEAGSRGDIAVSEVDRAGFSLRAVGPVPADAATFAHQLQRIRFEGVSFCYDADKCALAQLTVNISARSFTAIAGPSGAGKSTLMKLLLAAYEPDSGCIRLEGKAPDGVAWSCAPSCAPRGLFAYVPQGNRLMAGTVRDAVAFAETGPVPDEARVAAACKAACADGFIAQLPEGLDTVLGEHGSGLSEGQMQRLAVARAVYSGAPVLLLDEATSALDAATEREMLTRLRELPGRTVVIVTHRPEAIALCDGVVHVDDADGRVSVADKGATV